MILLGSSRHTRLARCFHHVPDIPFFLLGALLRIFLNDDSACVVEDFLFVRHPFTLETCVFEGDFDGIAYFSLTHRGSYERCSYPGLFKRCVRYAPNAVTLAVLHECFSNTLSVKDLEVCILFCAEHGHCEKLLWLINHYAYRGDKLDMAEFEILYSLRERHDQVPLTSIGFVEGAQDMVDAGVISTERPQTREMRLRKCLAVLQQKK